MGNYTLSKTIMAETVNLVTNDGETTTVAVETIKKSVLVNGLIEDAGIEEDIPLPQIKKETLEKVIVYCEYLKDHEPPTINKPLSSVDMVEIADQWNADYVDLPQDKLFELVMAANYLDIKSLLDVACAKVTSYIKNKSVKEIR